MSEVFSGRCFGGPLDGQGLQHRAPFYRHAIRLPVRWLSPEDTPTYSASEGIVEYRHTVIGWTDERGTRRIPLWVLADQSETDVLEMFRQQFPQGPD